MNMRYFILIKNIYQVLDNIIKPLYNGTMKRPADRIRRATLKDVAEYARVSQSAASTALSGLNNSIRVSPQTVERIRQAAKVLGYRDASEKAYAPVQRIVISEDKAVAGAPQGRPIVAGIIAQPSDPWYNDVTAGFEVAIGRRDGSTTHYVDRARPGLAPLPASESIARLVDQGANALVMIDFDWLNVVAENVAALDASGVPYVIVSAGPLGMPVSNVCYDNRAAGFQAATHLIQQGHRKILFFATVSADWLDERIGGAYAAIRYAGLDDDSLMVFPGNREPIPPARDWENVWHHTDRSYQLARDLFRDGLPASAVIAANDETAVGIARAAEEAGLRLWKDLAMIGFDDIPDAKLYGISTLRAPREEMGREAAKMLFGIFDDNKTGSQICLRSNLIVRASSRRRDVPSISEELGKQTSV